MHSVAPRRPTAVRLNLKPLPLSGRHDSEPGSESLGGGIMVPGCSPLTQADSELAAALASWLTEVQWPGPLALTHLGAQAAACVHNRR
jgi:hypothetical protein